MMLIIISCSLFFDWLKLRNEFIASASGEMARCTYLYETNRCDTPVPVILKQCVEWEACAHTRNISWMLIWAEIINRLLGSIFAQGSHIVIPLTITIIIFLLSRFDWGILVQLSRVSRDIICYFIMCVMIIFITWFVYYAYVATLNIFWCDWLKSLYL